MRKGMLTIIVFLVAGLNAWGAESFQQRLNKANADLKNGKIDDALTAYRDLQTEDPESETLYYDFGCAHYRQGKEAGDQKQVQEALTSFGEAKKSFEKVLNARDPEIRKNASFKHANAVAQIALQSKEAKKYDETKKAFEESVKEYEAFLKQYPKHQGARAKLDYMRYVLKDMLQKPPPPQEQQGKGDEKKDQKGDKKQEQKDDKKQEQKDQKGENKDQEKKDEQKEAKKDEKKDEKSEKAQEASELKEASKDEKDQKEKSPDEAKPDDKQNVDAILQSLEDTDHREQRDMKNQRNEVKMRKEWW